MFAREGEQEDFATMNTPHEQETLTVELSKLELAQLEVIGRKRRMSVEEQILEAIARYAQARQRSR